MSMRMNPVLGREVRERMRTPRAFVALTIFLLFLVLTVYIVYQGNTATGSFQVDLARQTRLGRDLYEWVLFIMLALILFFVPGLSAGAVAGERERQTLLPLQVTLLRPRNVLIGKILAAIAFLTLLIVASIPVMVVAYLLGGIQLVDGIKGIAVLLVVSILVSTMVVSISAFAKRVQSATLLSYSFVALLVLFGPILYFTMHIVDQSSGTDRSNPPAVILAMSPLSIVADATAGENVFVGQNPLSGVRQTLVTAKGKTSGSWFSWFPEDDFSADFAGRGERSGFPAWGLGTIGLGLLAAVLFLLANRRLRTPAETER
jgi:ABC-2 type transport system permease protein